MRAGIQAEQPGDGQVAGSNPVHSSRGGSSGKVSPILAVASLVSILRDAVGRTHYPRPMNLVRTEQGVAVDRGDAGLLLVRHIMGIGMNYAAHAKEQGKGVPERPVVFTKNPMAACLHGDDIVV